MTVPRAGDFWIRREPSRRGVRTVVYINNVNADSIGTRHVDRQVIMEGPRRRQIIYNIQSAWHNRGVFLTNYMVAAPSEIPDYYYGRVGQLSVMLDTEGGTSPSGVWSDSIIHNAYEYLMGKKQPKEKPQRKRKGFATFILEKGL